MRGLEHAYTESLRREDSEVDEDTNLGWKVFSPSARIYSDLLNNHVSFIGMRWDCCSRNCLVGLAMKVSVVVHLVRTVARKNIFRHCYFINHFYLL